MRSPSPSPSGQAIDQELALDLDARGRGLVHRDGTLRARAAAPVDLLLHSGDGRCCVDAARERLALDVGRRPQRRPHPARQLRRAPARGRPARRAAGRPRGADADRCTSRARRCGARRSRARRATSCRSCRRAGSATCSRRLLEMRALCRSSACGAPWCRWRCSTQRRRRSSASWWSSRGSTCAVGAPRTRSRLHARAVRGYEDAHGAGCASGARAGLAARGAPGARRGGLAAGGPPAGARLCPGSLALPPPGRAPTGRSRRAARSWG